MPLGDVTAFHEWIARRNPYLPVRQMVWRWIKVLADESWKVPSLPVEELSDRPAYEIRRVVLIYESAGDETKEFEEHIDVLWRVTFTQEVGETDLVDLIDVDTIENP